ncbi:MAG: prolipoprotein diacylglyceryl transferase [Elusimicrobia bacterium]|nr:prolipoprotein diacylglyceryl transferase [Elusimicrobiota bacterium]MDE2314479.1 prolipoprotein diacylglyceryl transferase [Elusimicrobiota bacterium]
MHPVLLQFGQFRLFTYGVMIAVGGVFSVFFWRRRWAKMGLACEEDLWLLVNILIVSAFLGGRILDQFEDVGIHNPNFWKDAFAFGQGFAVMGAFVAVLLAVYGFCRWKKIPFLNLADYLCLGVPFWQFFGRWGCFAAGCCYGLPMSRPWPWGVTFTNPLSQINPLFLGRLVHPTQLYEAFGDLAIGLALYFFVIGRVEKKELPRGSVCAIYLASYGVLRFMIEFYRGDVTMLPIGITVAQAFCLGLLALSGGIFLSIRRKS